MDDQRKDTVERAAKLHGFAGRQREGIPVETGKGVVDDGSWSTGMLWDNAHGGQPELSEFAEPVVWKNHPGGAVHHVGEFIAEEI